MTEREKRPFGEGLFDFDDEPEPLRLEQGRAVGPLGVVVYDDEPRPDDTDPDDEIPETEGA